MIVFGIDVPLVELLLALFLIMFVLFLETIVIIFLLVRLLNKAKK